MLLTILFPFRTTYRKLELQNRWWHRLAVALFGLLMIILTLSFSSNRVSDDLQERDAQLNRASSNFMSQVDTLDDSVASRTKTYELSKRYEQVSAELRHEYDIRLAEDYGAICGFCLSLSYILQCMYRLAIYVAFGSRTNAVGQ